jgi:hypothetical protein
MTRSVAAKRVVTSRKQKVAARASAFHFHDALDDRLKQLAEASTRFSVTQPVTGGVTITDKITRRSHTVGILNAGVVLTTLNTLFPATRKK